MALYFVVKKWDLSFTSLVTAHLVFPDDWLETWSLCLFQHCTLDSKIAMDIKDLNWIGQKKTFLRKYGVFVSFQNVPMFFRRSVNLYTVSTCQQWLKNLIFFFQAMVNEAKGLPQTGMVNLLPFIKKGFLGSFIWGKKCGFDLLFHPESTTGISNCAAVPYHCSGVLVYHVVSFKWISSLH